MNINLHIERLVLDGIAVSHREQRQLQAALEAELAHLLGQGGLAPSLLGGGMLPDVPAGAISPPAEGQPAQLGQQIARAVYGGIRR
jgi:hypothetical protein